METTRIMLENQRWLWTVVYSRLGDRAATEDVLQEISLAAIRNERQRNQIREVKGWLYQVAVRQVLLFRRKEARNRRRIEAVSQDGRNTGEGCLEHHVQSIDQLAKLEESELVNEGLLQLRPTDRQVLLMKYRDELSCREISERFGVAESTIQSRLLRARRKLREVLLTQECFQDYQK